MEKMCLGRVELEWVDVGLVRLYWKNMDLKILGSDWMRRVRHSRDGMNLAEIGCVGQRLARSRLT